MQLKDKVSLITGGARGIGFAIAEKFAEKGSNIVICDVDERSIKDAEEKLRTTGKQVLTGKVDVTKFSQVQSFIQKILDKFGRIDILINNAGITRDSLLVRMGESDWDTVLDVNLKGVFNFSKQVVKKSMIKNRAGCIVNIASIIGVIGNPGQANYAASKGGVIALTKTMAKELSKRGIRVNAIAPGFIETRMTEKLSDNVKEKYLEVIPLGRLGSPDEVAKVVNFLATENSSYITGQVINVDGGMVM